MPRKPKRFFVHPESISENSASLDPVETHHLRDVLRLSIGDELEVFDGEGNLYRVRVDKFQKNTTRLKVEEKIFSLALPAFELHVAVAIPQRGKMDIIVEKATELGVTALIPIVTDRTVVRPSKKDKGAIARWKKISCQTAKQSHILKLPIIEEVQSISKYADSIQTKTSLILVAHPENAKEANYSFLKDIRFLLRGKIKRIVLFIGPEGGFTEQDIGELKPLNAIIFSMGEILLKVDTAFIAATSFIKYGLGI